MRAKAQDSEGNGPSTAFCEDRKVEISFTNNSFHQANGENGRCFEKQRDNAKAACEKGVQWSRVSKEDTKNWYDGFVASHGAPRTKAQVSKKRNAELLLDYDELDTGEKK